MQRNEDFPTFASFFKAHNQQKSQIVIAQMAGDIALSSLTTVSVLQRSKAVCESSTHLVTERFFCCFCCFFEVQGTDLMYTVACSA